VVVIASNGGGKPALETLQRLLPILCEEHGLTTDQVVAIASHHGAKQALETVQRLLPALCKDHDLTTDQVVAIANHDGGKPALETVQRLLPVLCKDYGLSKHQVVDIASYDGGKQALETVQRLLPVLCNEHGLAPYQVVAIASNSGGRQALESLFAQLSRPDPALSNDRLVALACLGGRPALEAVIKGLPHAPTLIRRANRRVLDHTSRRAADPAQVVQVLSFFQCHSHPERAFDEAMQQFGMSRRELLKFLRRVGVTELEACNGTLPPTSQRWQRILHALGKQSSSVSSPRQESSHAFADALEHESDAPSPMQEAGQALICTSRKRLRSDDALHRSPLQPAQAQDPEQPDALDAHLPSGWSRKRSRTKIGHGLLDPGTPTDADLEASNTLFVGQDAATFASTEEDFPAFDDEEMEWLIQLLP
jgi:type III effector protein AvrBs3